MKDPRRLVHEHPSALARSLLSAGRAEEPNNALLASTLAGTLGSTGLMLGHTSAQLTGASVPPASLAAPAVSSTGMKGAVWLAASLKWVGIASVGGALTLSGVREFKAKLPLQVRSAQATHQSLPTAPKADVPSVQVASPALSAQSAPEPNEANGVSSATRSARLTAPVVPPASSALAAQLSEEARVIDEARAAVASGDGAGALRSLELYRKRFERPRLTPEALYLRMQALRLQGDSVAAASVAERLLHDYPNGPQSAAARALLNSQGR